MPHIPIEHQSLDAIYKAFMPYIRGQNYFDIVYSDKLGYLRILINSPEEGVTILDMPEKMLEYLCSDVINDVVYSLDNPKRSDNDLVLTEYEKAESRRRLSTIFETLESNHDLCAALANRYINAYQGNTES